MERCLACEADAVGTVECFPLVALLAFPELPALVTVHVFTRLDGSLKTGSQLWVNLLERCEIFLGVFLLTRLNV